jgi:hypothetical protein
VDYRAAVWQGVGRGGRGGPPPAPKLCNLAERAHFADGKVPGHLQSVTVVIDDRIEPAGPADPWVRGRGGLRNSRPARLSEQQELSLLVDRVSSGDKAAFASLYDATSCMVFGMVALVIKDPSQASEVALDIYVEAWATAPAFDASQGNPSDWLRSIAVRRIALAHV